MKGKLAILFVFLGLVSLLVGLVNPWWRWSHKSGDRNINSNSICFLDASCSHAEFEGNPDFGAQRVYRITLILIIVSIILVLALGHSVFSLWTKRYHHRYYRFSGLLLGFLSVTMILSAVIYFPVAIERTYSLDMFLNSSSSITQGSPKIGSLYGHSKLPGTNDSVEWALLSGWYLCILSLVFVLLGLFFVVTMTNHHQEPLIRRRYRVSLHEPPLPHTYESHPYFVKHNLSRM